MSQNLKERTAKGLFWGAFSNLFQQVIQLGFGIFLARILSPSDVGLVGLLSIFTLIATSLQESGFSVALITKKNADQKDYSTIFWVNIGISLSLYALLCFFSPSIANFYEHPALTSISKVLFLTFVFNAFGIVQNTILTKKLDMKNLAIVNLSSILISCTVGLTFALLGFSYWSIVYQAITLSFSKTAMLWWRSDWRPSFTFSAARIKEMLPFSIKILLTNIVSQSSSGIYSTLLGKTYDEEQVGYYNQANKWYIIPFSIVYGIVNSTAFPVLAELNGENERQRLAFRKLLRFTAFISFPLILGFAFVTPEFIPILITDKWLPSVPILQLLCVWAAFMPMVSIYNNAITIRGFSGILLILTLGYGITLITTLLLTVHLGIIKMLLWNLGVNLLFFFSHILIAKKKLGYRIRDFIKDVFPFLGITLFIFGLVYLIVYRIENIYFLLLSKILLSVFLYVFIMKISGAAIFKEIILFAKDKFLKMKNAG